MRVEMRIAALVVSPDLVPLDHAVDVLALVEFDGPARPIEVCISVSAPVALDHRAMLCQSVFASSPASVSFRVRITAPASQTTCEFTVLAGDDDGQTCELHQTIRLAR